MFWFYVAHMKGHFAMGSSESILDADIAALRRAGDLDHLLGTLKSHVRDLFVSLDEIAGKGRRSAYFSLLFMIAKQANVRDWSTSYQITERMVGKAHAVQFHHIFPKARLKKIGREHREINEIANLAFIGGRTNRTVSDKEPKVYLPGVVAKQGDEILAEHLLPDDQELWKLENYDDFISFRRKRIVDTINSFLKKVNPEK